MGMVLLASWRLSAKAGSHHQGLSFPGLSAGIESFVIGPISCLFLLQGVPLFSHVVHVILAVRMSAASNLVLVSECFFGESVVGYVGNSLQRPLFSS